MRGKLSTLGLVLILSALIFGGFGVALVHARSMGTYIVRPGDTMITIAARHGISVSELAGANGLSWDSWVYVGQRLIIPGSQPGPSTVHVVQRGDTLSSIARRFGTAVGAIMRANGLTSTCIYAGQRLAIPGSQADSATNYIMRRGDTLFSIARRFGTTVQAIMAANNLRSTRILVGQWLVIPGHDSVPGHPTVAISPTSGPSGSVVEVAARGFPSHTSMSVGLGPQNSEFGEVARGTTDSNGRFTAEVSVEGAAGMNWVFGANAGDAHATSVPFQITEGIPTVAISPTSGPSGTLVQVIGSGFPSHTSVSVGVGPEGSEFGEITRGVTDANGRFTMNVRLQGAPGMGLVLAAAAEGQPGVRSHDVFRITN
jgi:LysM repeat protein